MDNNETSKTFQIEGENYKKLISKEEIDNRVKEIGNQIFQDYKDNNGRDLVLVGVLTGAVVFLSDLAREIPHPRLRLDTIGITSYEGSTESNRQPKFVSDLKDTIYDADVIIVEDIVDTGYSMSSLLKILSAREPHSLKVAALLSKPERREIDVPIDYLGFEIPDVFVLGNGLDCQGAGRGFKDIVVKE